ncbi:hypothetical protein [Pseudoxanthomonas sp. 10H]|uniref:hypothetical protein n=1 Tax=Pseudoxanthomonas sp. 10H TaxID=3242729 RepID=UPI003557BDF3
MNPSVPSDDTRTAPRGEQTGKRSSDERNDPAVEPGAREGQPDSRRLREEPDHAAAPGAAPRRTP